ncbi:ribonuclease HII [Herbivorax sp. ANBcel31]|uniref:ribonuclease HII n=1 Tax=Herbivorax sp. ANBcel31 TaxID=3069754 RepID=UPI0027AFC242|nr:ribonuclease HII [Herbivorax sp. ANBcel31]MDQ2087205.1 ribonuclease HII [Herbivorax sp. ANBcel31]
MKYTIKSIEESIKDLSYNKALEKLYLLREECGDKVLKLIEKYEKKKNKYDLEVLRYEVMCKYEKDAYKRGISLIAGTDEAGRGPLAGPVVAAAVVLPEGIFIQGLNDSKKLSEKKREELFDIIKNEVLDVGIGMVDENEIDEINILNAAKKSMGLALNNLSRTPDLLLVDAEKLENPGVEQISITRGDTLSISIAAASIIAKVTRDRLMKEMDKEYPQYGFLNHKGYGTKEHINAIKKYGICPIHRISFTKKFAL